MVWARGVFSNESGMGSAPMQLPRPKTDHPLPAGAGLHDGHLPRHPGRLQHHRHRAGHRGLYATSGDTGAVLTSHTFNDLLPGPGGWLVTFGLVFAYSTILGWCYYGEGALPIWEARVVPIYRIIEAASRKNGEG